MKHFLLIIKQPAIIRDGFSGMSPDGSEKGFMGNVPHTMATSLIFCSMLSHKTEQMCDCVQLLATY
jgi:hypothetical protein